MNGCHEMPYCCDTLHDSNEKSPAPDTRSDVGLLEYLAGSLRLRWIPLSHS
jgi:hypothetical protein